MPGVLAAFFALSALLHGGTAVRALRDTIQMDQDGVHGDKIVRKPWVADGVHYVTFARKDVYGELGCDISAFPHTGTEGPLRLFISGRDAGVDTSWTWRQRIPANTSVSPTFMFVDPTGRVIMEISRTYNCVEVPSED